MAFRALQRRRLVEKNFLAGNLAHSFVTKITFYVGMSALQRELRSLIVIKNRRHPSRNVVAVRTRCFARFCNKLPTMPVRVAFFALLRRSLKLRLFRAG